MDQNELQVQGFLQQVLDYGIRKIYDRQLEIASQRRAERRANARRNYAAAGEQIIGHLRQRLSQLQVQGSTAEVISQIPLVMRFVDMKRYGNWEIYNKQVWGMLYRDVFSDLSQKYRSYIIFQMRLQLGRAFNADDAQKAANDAYLSVYSTASRY